MEKQRKLAVLRVWQAVAQSKQEAAARAEELFQERRQQTLGGAFSRWTALRQLAWKQRSAAITLHADLQERQQRRALQAWHAEAQAKKEARAAAHAMGQAVDMRRLCSSFEGFVLLRQLGRAQKVRLEKRQRHLVPSRRQDLLRGATRPQGSWRCVNKTQPTNENDCRNTILRIVVRPIIGLQ